MMKWVKPSVEEININETAHNWTGIYRDGGYIGDGEISGHLTWDNTTDGDSDNPENRLS